MDEFERIGADQFLAAYNGGKSIGRLLVDLTNDALAGYAPPLVGCWTVATSALDAVARAGLVKFSGDAKDWTGQRFRREGNRLLALRDYREFERLIGLLEGMLEGARRARPGLQLREAEEATPAAPEPAPVRVEVISMPPRVTTSEVSRDEGGNIASVSQIERDLKAA